MKSLMKTLDKINVTGANKRLLRKKIEFGEIKTEEELLRNVDAINKFGSKSHHKNKFNHKFTNHPSKSKVVKIKENNLA